MEKIETPKKTPAIAAAINEAQTELTLTFSNGLFITVETIRLSDSIKHYAMLHGLKQKLVDAAAISCNSETGRPATVEDKFYAVKEVFMRITDPTNPQWNKPRESGAAVAGGLLFKALCRMYSTKTPEYIREFLAKKTDAEKAALRKNPRVAEIIETIKAENAKEDDGSSDELLNELEAE
jgi:hypothetical protein